jgi:hypothetical protein
MKEIDIFPNATSAASSTTSVPYDLGDLQVFSVGVDFTGGAGDLAGTLTLKAANKHDFSDVVLVTGSTQAITASASHMWNVSGAGYRYVRVDWTYTSGTGNITARLIAKESVVKGA